MKNIYFLIVFILLAVSLFPYPNGVTGYTLKNNSAGCGSCHSTHGAASSLVQVTINGPLTLKPNQTGNYTVVITGGSGTAAGVNIASSNGVLLNIDSKLKVVNSELASTAKHSYTSGTIIYSFKYTAPSVTGNQTLFSTGMGKKKEWNFSENFIISVANPFISAPSDLFSSFSLFPTPKITLNWTDNSNNETGFRIERKKNNLIFETIAAIPANSISFMDTLNITDSSEYTYRVAAFNNDTVSSYSNEASQLVYLPVELIGVELFISEEGIKLKWKTTNELNNLGFEIEKSTDKSNWKVIAFVAGKCNSGCINDYEVTDMSDMKSFSGNVHYRIKQIDLDGSFKYFDGIYSLSFDNSPKTYQLSQNYPNPFNPSTTIDFYIPFDAYTKLEILNNLGETIILLADKFLQEGFYSFSFNGSNMPSGIYYYRLNSNNNSLIKKMLLLK